MRDQSKWAINERRKIWLNPRISSKCQPVSQFFFDFSNDLFLGIIKLISNVFFHANVVSYQNFYLFSTSEKNAVDWKCLNQNLINIRFTIATGVMLGKPSYYVYYLSHLLLSHTISFCDGNIFSTPLLLQEEYFLALCYLSRYLLFPSFMSGIRYVPLEAVWTELWR